MNKSKNIQINHKDQVKTVSIGAYKEKVQDKEKWIKEFEEGPQPVAGCTCGQHTDPNQFLTQGQVSRHYLKDRKRYVEGLKGPDPLESYMEIVENLMSDAPLVKLNMETDLAMMNYLSNHFNEGMKFYQQYIKDEGKLTTRARAKAEALKIGYEGYKEHMVKILINSYIIKKRRFIAENFDFAWTQKELLTREDTLETHLNESQGYIKLMEEHFRSADIEISTHTLSIVAKTLNRQINEKLKGHDLSSSDVATLGKQMKVSLDGIKQIIAKNRIRDFKTIKERYDKVKDDCSIEDKAQALIDIELRRREIDGSQYADESEFTVKSSTKQLIETIGMENLICKLPTKELESLFEEFEALEE